MTDTILKEMFRDALSGEPENAASVDEDIARGRSRRTCVLRRRAKAGAVFMTVVTIGLILPSVQGPVIDGEERRPTTSNGRGAVVAPEVAGDPLRLAMWEAVDATLPEDVRLRPGTSVTADGPGPGLMLELERGYLGFDVQVLLQNARPDLPGYRPCTEPDALIRDIVDTGGCEQGRDDEGRWRVAQGGSDGGLVVLEGDPAAVTLQWTLGSVQFDRGEPRVTAHPYVPDAPWFSAAEADAVADAVWAVGAQHSRADLVSGIDLQETRGDAWPAIEAALAAQLGPLTTIEPVGGDIAARVDGVDVQSGMISATFRTVDGAEVEIAVWQRDRSYDALCFEQYSVCQRPTGEYVELGAGPVGPDMTGRVGQRGSVRVQVNSSHRGLEMPVSRSVAGILPILPLIGEDR
jgi:hypothetical protein